MCSLHYKPHTKTHLHLFPSRTVGPWSNYWEKQTLLYYYTHCPRLNNELMINIYLSNAFVFKVTSRCFRAKNENMLQRQKEISCSTLGIIFIAECELFIFTSERGVERCLLSFASKHWQGKILMQDKKYVAAICGRWRLGVNKEKTAVVVGRNERAGFQQQRDRGR